MEDAHAGGRKASAKLAVYDISIGFGVFIGKLC